MKATKRKRTLVVIERYPIASFGREFVVYAPSHAVAAARFIRFVRAENLTPDLMFVSIEGRDSQTCCFLPNGTLIPEAT